MCAPNVWITQTTLLRSCSPEQGDRKAERSPNWPFWPPWSEETVVLLCGPRSCLILTFLNVVLVPSFQSSITVVVYLCFLLQWASLGGHCLQPQTLIALQVEFSMNHCYAVFRFWSTKATCVQQSTDVEKSGGVTPAVPVRDQPETQGPTRLSWCVCFACTKCVWVTGGWRKAANVSFLGLFNAPILPLVSATERK